MARPIVKWAGGKTSLLGELQRRVPADVRTYAEPFAGGAALFFALEADGARSFERAILADRNEDLIACYRAVQRDVEALIEALSGFRHDEAEYYRVRAEDGAAMSDVARGARFIYLNRTCFNGLWRVNKAGRFNVPFGRYDNPRIVDPDGLRAASRALARAELVVADFAEVTRALGPGDFAYFDPPYVPVSKSASFTAYAAGGFGPGDQARLLAELARLREAGALAMLSNADTAETRALYEGFAVEVVSAPRSINSKGGGRGAVGELLVTTWGAPGVHDASAGRASAAPQSAGATDEKLPRASTRTAR